ncbi:sialidase family protein [Catellatospora tritici]|uniref:sialidase family protein n=1 Tax=Catellatospora tritici TaxID=2851566 RepID=UPI001C2D418E|nr:sialidase family protein [Catellatospora tritici]MBV1854826.1 glycoside hydrolase [Catellatospora tritici]
MAGVLVVATATVGTLVYLEEHGPRLRGERELVGMSAAEVAEEAEEEGEAEGKARPNGITKQVWAAGMRVGDVTTAAAPGWTGQQLFDPTADDWEPAVAFDPAGTYGYILTTRYGAPKACGNCPAHQIWLKRTVDNGATWSAATYLCPCSGTKAQNDPLIEVANDGSVYAAWMNDYAPGVVFARSTDHGLTWTAPKAVKSKAMHFTDKPIMAISPTGRDVYLAFNSSDSYVAASHDFGATWGAPVKTNSDGRYYFAGGGAVLPNGTVVFTSSSFTQTSTGDVFVHVMRSTNGGASWTQTQVATTPEQPTCVALDCPVDYYGTIPALAADAGGKLVLTYTGPTVAKGPQRVYAIRSADGGLTWSAPQDLGGPSGANANFSAITGRGTGDFRMYFMDSRNGPDAWNTWYRASTDGGVTWSAEVRISDATAGPAYVTTGGFFEPYGDYGEIATTSTGKTVAVWGEGPDYRGPGGVWINRGL